MDNGEFMRFANEQMALNMYSNINYNTIIIGIASLAAAIALLILAVMSVRALLDMLTVNHMKKNGVTQITKTKYRPYKKRRTVNYRRNR